MINKKLLTLPIAGAAALGLAKYRKHIISQLLDLPRPRYAVAKESNIRLIMSDGATLATDHYYPKGIRKGPAIMIRTPYGRGGLMGIVNILRAQQMAARGYHVICQDVRGRFDSDGYFEPFVNERKDGQETVEWITSQPWSNGAVGLWGQSYSGYANWGVATLNHNALKAMLTSVTSSNINPIKMDGFPLDLILRWLLVLDATTNSNLTAWERISRLSRPETQDRLLAPGFIHLPLATADEVILENPSPFFETWRKHADPDDFYWTEIDFSDHVVDVKAPVHFVSGWFDVFLGGLLADYKSLQRAGRKPFLTIGPWHHYSTACALESLRQGFLWFDTHLLLKSQILRRHPVRVFLMGADKWLEMESWPPPAESRKLYLSDGGRLITERPAHEIATDTYRYDPADPTPGFGGPLLSYSAGSIDNRPLEARPDVLTYTTESLERDIDVIGSVKCLIYVKSSSEFTTFFARLCDVHPNGKSLNICDGLYEISPTRDGFQPDGSRYIEIDMLATAQRFKAGHRIRLQISSGAHPRFARSLGTDESIFNGVQMSSADQQVFHGKMRPSALIIPVMN